jgi:hypothetical protein
MPQFNITATSAEKNLTVSNTAEPRYANPDETPKQVILFPSPAEFVDQAAATANAEKYAKWLNSEDYEGAWDWIGSAQAV